MKNEIMKTLKDLLSFKTYAENEDEFTKLFNYIKENYKELNITEYEFNNKKCLALSNTTSKDVDLLFCTHIDVVYARTDLVNSNSEWIMQRAGMQICEDPEGIITEWVDVADGVGDYRLHLWLPLKEELYLERKPAALNADSKTRKITAPNAKVLYKKANEQLHHFQH